MNPRRRKAPIVGRLSRPWAAVPVDLMEERSLSATARLVLIYLIGLAARPGWTIYVSQVRAALGLGEYAWTEARKQLEVAGYYWSERQKENDGTWRWVHIVTDVPELSGGQGDEVVHPPEPSIPGKPGDGSPGHGAPGDIRSNKAPTNKICTTTSTSAAIEGLIYPQGLGSREVVVIGEFLSGLDRGLQQGVLDELAGAMDKPGIIKTSPVAFLRALASRAAKGEFHPSLGIRVVAARNRKATAEKTKAIERANRLRREEAARSPAAQKAMRACIAQIGIALSRNG